LHIRQLEDVVYYCRKDEIFVARVSEKDGCWKHAHDINNTVSVLYYWGSNTNPIVSMVMSEITTFQCLLILMHQFIFIISFNNILDSILLVCNNKNVFIRDTMNIFWIASVQWFSRFKNPWSRQFWFCMTRRYFKYICLLQFSK
jgi:hypothetical protein